MSYPLYQAGRNKIENPILIQKLFTNTRLAWVWVPLRLYLGWVWLSAGWERLSDAAWLTNGEAVRRYWSDAIAASADGAAHTNPVSWYRALLQLLLDGGHYTWIARLVVFAEVVVGALLILGAFTGIAAALAAFMNWNFIIFHFFL